MRPTHDSHHHHRHPPHSGAPQRLLDLHLQPAHQQPKIPTPGRGRPRWGKFHLLLCIINSEKHLLFHKPEDLSYNNSQDSSNLSQDQNKRSEVNIKNVIIIDFYFQFLCCQHYHNIAFSYVTFYL